MVFSEFIEPPSPERAPDPPVHFDSVTTGAERLVAANVGRSVQTYTPTVADGADPGEFS